jgi:hypothetical protein
VKLLYKCSCLVMFCMVVITVIRIATLSLPTGHIVAHTIFGTVAFGLALLSLAAAWACEMNGYCRDCERSISARGWCENCGKGVGSDDKTTGVIGLLPISWSTSNGSSLHSFTDLDSI